jgi:hypothetical protein
LVNARTPTPLPAANKDDELRRYAVANSTGFLGQEERSAATADGAILVRRLAPLRVWRQAWFDDYRRHAGGSDSADRAAQSFQFLGGQ